MTRILTNLLIAFVLFLLFLATIFGISWLIAIHGEQVFLFALFFMVAMVPLYAAVACYRGDL